MKAAKDNHQDVFFVLVVKQRLPQPLTDEGGRSRTLEIHGGELGEGVLIQVNVVVFLRIELHWKVINVDFFQPPPSYVLQTNSDMSQWFAKCMVCKMIDQTR